MKVSEKHNMKEIRKRRLKAMQDNGLMTNGRDTYEALKYIYY